MPEYVYAVHQFQPENEDELGLQVGECIEVVEKDDEFGDGWWQGRSASGKEGLFPVSYTVSTPPRNDDVSNAEPESNPPLQTLPEEPENESPPIHSPIPKTASVPSFLDMAEEHSGQEIPPENNPPEGEVMRATMTDVQKAIEQLGRGGPADDYDDGARSFSFASTKEGGDTEDDTDFDFSDLDGGPGEGGDREGWHKTARRKLAAKAKRAVENAKQLEAMMNGDSSTSTRRVVAPPIDVEISDESEAEDGGDFTRTIKRTHPGILEEDENEGEMLISQNKEPTAEDDLEVPPEDETNMPTATADTRTFQVPSQPLISESTLDEQTPRPEQLASAQPGLEKFVESESVSYPTPVSLAPAAEVPASIPRSQSKVDHQKHPYSPQSGLPSPAASTHRSQVAHPNLDSVVPSVTPGTPIAEPPSRRLQASEVSQIDDLKKIPTSEWNVELVVQWLKSKGFDQGICDKFTEQEITGDVLLELDANVLKSEIGIMAYGKRVRIANAIAELQRPPSFEFPTQNSNSNLPSPVYSNTQFHYAQPDMAPMMHSRIKSQGQQSHHSFPGSAKSVLTRHKYSQSMQSSVGSAALFTHQQEQEREQERDNEVATIPSQDMSETGRRGSKINSTTSVGLGINLNSNGRHPSSLSPSASDTALGDSSTTIPAPSIDEELGHLSETEAAPRSTSKRRRFFGRSHDSAMSKQIPSPMPSPTVREVDKDNSPGKESPRNSGSFGSRKGKKVSEGGKQGERLSIFGGSFVGPRSKHRKPPPSVDFPTERPNKFSLPRLQSRKSSASNRSFTPVGSPNQETTSSAGNSPVKNSFSTTIERPDPGLRKRTSSAPHPTLGLPSTDAEEKSVTGAIKQGQSIMQQIGEPDHAGWMRKKGERYNMWKTRYLILKGSHLYCLRSNNTSEKRLKEYINIQGYKVTVDEGIDPGRYGFRIEHDHDKTHYFSSEDKALVRDWMKAFMKATIERDYSKPVVSSCNMPTIPLVVAQAMNPAPRPPSPAARAATQRALRRENTNQLSSRDARVLMGLAGDVNEERPYEDAYFENGRSPPADVSANTDTTIAPPSRPSREKRRSTSVHTAKGGVADDELVEWANSHLPEQHQIKDPYGSLCSGLALLRLAETIKGQSASPSVPDSAFPRDINDEKLDGFVSLFDFLLDNEVKMGSVSINDVRFGKREKILQLLKGLKSWEEKRKMLSTTMVRSPQYSLSGWAPLA